MLLGLLCLRLAGLLAQTTVAFPFRYSVERNPQATALGVARGLNEFGDPQKPDPDQSAQVDNQHSHQQPAPVYNGPEASPITCALGRPTHPSVQNRRGEKVALNFVGFRNIHSSCRQLLADTGQRTRNHRVPDDSGGRHPRVVQQQRRTSFPERALSPPRCSPLDRIIRGCIPSCRASGFFDECDPARPCCYSPAPSVQRPGLFHEHVTASARSSESCRRPARHRPGHRPPRRRQRPRRRGNPSDPTAGHPRR